MNYIRAKKEDFEQLVKLRIEVMKPSLEKIGRFSHDRARVRFKESFIPERTTVVMDNNKLIGFYMVTENTNELFLNHLYIALEYQGKGFGKSILNRVKELSIKLNKPIGLEALKESPANNFYLNNGFEQISSTEFDNIYLWKSNER